VLTAHSIHMGQAHFIIKATMGCLLLSMDTLISVSGHPIMIRSEESITQAFPPSHKTMVEVHQSLIMKIPLMHLLKTLKAKVTREVHL
jgi:hypothetical protein